MNPKLAELVMRCLHLVTQAHVRHLGTRTYARHMALEGVYNEVGDLADGLCESAQGKYGLMALNGSYTPPVGDLECLQEMAQWLEANRAACPQDSWIQNQIDEIVALLYQGIYKIRFLA